MESSSLAQTCFGCMSAALQPVGRRTPYSSWPKSVSRVLGQRVSAMLASCPLGVKCIVIHEFKRVFTQSLIQRINTCNQRPCRCIHLVGPRRERRAVLASVWLKFARIVYPVPRRLVQRLRVTAS